jgi:hypothetical protein
MLKRSNGLDHSVPEDSGRIDGGALADQHLRICASYQVERII